MKWNKPMNATIDFTEEERQAVDTTIDLLTKFRDNFNELFGMTHNEVYFKNVDNGFSMDYDEVLNVFESIGEFGDLISALKIEAFEF